MSLLSQNADGVQVEVHGVELSAAQKERLFTGLSQIQHEAPSDATSRMTVSSSGDGFELKIVIRSLARRFEVEALGSRFEEALEGLLGTVGRQLTLWQEQRWNEGQVIA